MQVISPDSIFQVPEFAPLPPTKIEENGLENNTRIAIPIAVHLKEQKITPIALKMIEIIRTIAFTVRLNIDYLNTESIVNSLRLKKIHHKIKTIEQKISEHPNQEDLIDIKKIFKLILNLITLKDKSIKPHLKLANELRSLIHQETNSLIEITDFPPKTFLVCLTTPPTEKSFVYISLEALDVARAVYNLFLQNVPIIGSSDFISMVQGYIKCLIGFLAHNDEIMDAFQKIFSHPEKKLTFEEGDNFLYNITDKKNSTILLKKEYSLFSNVKNKKEEIVNETGIEFQIVTTIFHVAFHELIHHILYALSVPIAEYPNLNEWEWTINEEKMVITGEKADSALFENYLSKILSLPYRASHRWGCPSLKEHQDYYGFKHMILRYFQNYRYTRLLDVEFRDDILPFQKPTSNSFKIFQIDIVRNAPEPLKDQFISLGYKKNLTYQEQIEEYKYSITSTSSSLYLLLKYFDIPKQVLAELFSSPWIKDEKVREKLLAMENLDESYKSLLTKEITEQSTHPTLEQLI